MQKRTQGDEGERLARGWLEAKGYNFIASNFTRRVGELDLIMAAPDGLTIVFVEVRYRANQSFGGAICSIDFRKQAKLRKTANAWLQKNADSCVPARIDVIALSPLSHQTPAEQQWQGYELNWIKNAIEG